MYMSSEFTAEIVLCLPRMHVWFVRRQRLALFLNAISATEFPFNVSVLHEFQFHDWCTRVPFPTHYLQKMSSFPSRFSHHLSQEWNRIFGHTSFRWKQLGFRGKPVITVLPFYAMVKPNRASQCNIFDLWTKQYFDLARMNDFQLWKWEKWRERVFQQ